MKKGCAVAVVAEDDRPRQFPTVFCAQISFALILGFADIEFTVIRNTDCRRITEGFVVGRLPSG